MVALVRTAYLLTGDVHHAEDLTQTALAKAYRSWRRVRAATPGGVRPADARHLQQRPVPQAAGEEALTAAPPDGRGGTRPWRGSRSVARCWAGWPGCRPGNGRWSSCGTGRTCRRRRSPRCSGCSPGTVKSQASKGLAKLERIRARRAAASGRRGPRQARRAGRNSERTERAAGTSERAHVRELLSEDAYTIRPSPAPTRDPPRGLAERRRRVAAGRCGPGDPGRGAVGAFARAAGARGRPTRRRRTTNGVRERHTQPGHDEGTRGARGGPTAGGAPPGPRGRPRMVSCWTGSPSRRRRTGWRACLKAEAGPRPVWARPGTTGSSWPRIARATPTPPVTASTSSA